MSNLAIKPDATPIQRFGDDIEPVSRAAMIKALALNDYSRLTPEERLMWVGALAKATGANPLVRIVEWLTFQGRLQPYATKAFAEQMRLIHNISVRVKSRKRDEGCVIVEVEGKTPDGRVDESMAAIPLAASDIGEKFAAAAMKAETKAKRRLTLSMMGLGFMEGVDRGDGEPAPASAAEPAPGVDVNQIIAEPIKVEVVDEQPPSPPDEETQVPTVPPCPETAADWLAGMKRRCQEMGLPDSTTTRKLNATYKAHGATSHLTMTADQRAEAWAKAHSASE